MAPVFLLSVDLCCGIRNVLCADQVSGVVLNT